ncbi:MAG: flippase [Clostridium sp.]|nr:flippase [Clostridium sp.]
MEKRKSVKLNAMLNVMKVGLSIIFPLITFPYASRVLGVENLGRVNYGSSIISYFILLASMGVTSYAVREGAKIRNDEKLFNEFANEVFTVNIFTTIVSYLFLILSFIVFSKLHNYASVIIIQSFSIVFATLGVEWVNNIYEDYLYITLRSIAIQVISLICLFIFIKKPEDYLIYAGITVLGNGLICILNLIHCRKFVKLKIIAKCNLKKHLKPMIIFFSNTIAVTIYVSADMTMLGWIIGSYYVGLYTVSVKIYQIIKQLLTAIYFVSIPRLSSYAEKKNYSEYKSLLSEICSVLLLIMLPMCTGLAVLSEKLILLLSGEKYIEATMSLRILSVALFFAVVGGIIVNCVNTPLGREKSSLRATVIAAIINIVLNIIFIPIFYQNGAAFTTVVSELLVCIICIYDNKEIGKFIDLNVILRQARYAIIECIWIVVVGILLSIYITSTVYYIISVMFFSFIGYLFILFIGQNKYAISILNLLKDKFEFN